ncbi:MAG: DMT family transporter [Clostridia bacterium]|nr:DMT family transporter [Clostridia bacterium]
MKQLRGALLLMLAALIWGTAFVAQSIGMDHIGPFTFNSVRNFIASLVLVPVILFLRHRQDPAKVSGAAKHYKKALWTGGVLCGIALTVASSLQQIGIQYTSVGKAGFLTALYIVIVPIFGLFLKKRVPAAVWISVIIAAVGTYLLSIKENFTIGAGDLYVILCAFVFSVHILLVDRFSPQVSGVELSSIQFLTVGVLSGIVSLLAEKPDVHSILISMGPVLYTALLSSGVAYTLQIIGQKDTPPAVASLVMSLESVFAALSGWIVLKQSLQGRELLGCVLVFAAVILAQIPFDELKRKILSKKLK